MKYIKLFESFINERIRASEAYHTMNGVQTVIDGKRELAYIATSTHPYIDNTRELEAFEYAKKNGLNFIKVKNRKDGEAWIVYKNNKKRAQELADYAAKHDGYLEDTTPEEAEYVGNLLGYDKRDIKQFVKDHYYKNKIGIQ